MKRHFSGATCQHLGVIWNIKSVASAKMFQTIKSTVAFQLALKESCWIKQQMVQKYPYICVGHFRHSTIRDRPNHFTKSALSLCELRKKLIIRRPATKLPSKLIHNGENNRKSGKNLNIRRIQWRFFGNSGRKRSRFLWKAGERI